MADKMNCPGCDYTGSGVLQAFREGRSCPECGLSHEAAAEILAIREKGADEQLTRRLEEALKELGQVKAELGTMKWRLAAVQDALNSEPPGWD